MSPRMSQLTGPLSPLPCPSQRVDGMNFQGHSQAMILYKERQGKGKEENCLKMLRAQEDLGPWIWS